MVINAFRTHLLAVVSLLCAAQPLDATLVVPADVPTLVAESRAIVHGRVVGVRAEWMSDRRDIQTFVTLDVERFLKGGPARTVTFRVPGGELGIYRSLIPGAPAFETGDEVVLFLGGRGPTVPHVLGLFQGVFRVVRASDAAVPVVILPVPRSAPGQRAQDPPVPLAEFTREVAALLRSGP